MDDSKENRIAGAVGFNVRTGSYHVFKSKTVICGAGGASNIFKPRSDFFCTGCNFQTLCNVYRLNALLAKARTR